MPATKKATGKTIERSASKANANRASTKKASTKKARAATAPKRTTPKVSPLRGTPVDTWQKKLSGWQARAFELLRAVVAKAAPSATLSIKWAQPVWEQNGPFAWARPAAKHFSFGFWRGAELKDSGGVLEGSGGVMRHVKLTSAEDVADLDLAGFVRQAVALNEKKGDPTKRGQ